MSTLVLRLAAPMQSWGADSKYNYRRTRREPTKSGVLGLLAAALGCERDDTEALAELSKLRFGVRVDREGTPLRDFQMAHALKNGKKEEATLTWRDYLCDAVFLVGLEGPQEQLERLKEALTCPVYSLFLGRRSCPPTGRLCLGIRHQPLEETLRTEPWQVADWRQKSTERNVRLVLDTERSFAQLQDVPISFSPMKREYGYRNIREEIIQIPVLAETEHDPMSEL